MDRAAPESEQPAGRGSSAGGMVGLHRDEPRCSGGPVVDRRVDDDEREPLGNVEPARERRRLVEDHRSIHALVAQAREALGDRLAACRCDDGEREAVPGRRIGERLQHARVADRGERRHDQSDGVGAARAQGARRAMHAVAEAFHRRLHAGARGRVDSRRVVDDARDGLRRHSGGGGDVRHRRPAWGW